MDRTKLRLLWDVEAGDRGPEFGRGAGRLNHQVGLAVKPDRAFLDRQSGKG